MHLLMAELSKLSKNFWRIRYMENKQALTNKIELQFDRDRIDRDFSIFAITTDEKYINKGAAILDDPNGDLKAVSLAFDYGRLAWVMFRKTDKVTNIDILNFIEKDERSKGHFTVEQKSAWDLNKDHLLFKLFLCSLSLERKEKYAFNNLTGKLFISSEKWVKSKTINALQIDVDWLMNMSFSYTTFTKISELKKYEINISDMPKYTWSGNGFMLKRTFDASLKDDSVFAHVPISKKTKPHLDFYEYSQDKRLNTKVYYAYLVLNVLKDRYSAYFKEQPHFSSLDVVDESVSFDDKKYMVNVISHFVGDNSLSVRLINQCSGEHDDILETIKSELYKILKDKDGVVVDMTIGHRFMPSTNTCYIVLHHNADYYASEKMEDPYAKLKRDVLPIQSITVEDSEEPIKKGGINEKDKIQAFYKTILKELVIKNDIINLKKITIDDWEKRSYTKNWVFGIEQDDSRYMMLVFPSGEFKFFTDSGFGLFPFNCEYEEVNKAARLLRDSKEKTKSIVVDQDGNALLLSKSGMLIMPKEGILHLDHSLHNKDIIGEYFIGGYDTTIYARGPYSYYSSGIPHGSKGIMPNGTNVYNVKVLEGNNMIKSLLTTFSVPFVRLDGFTVLPYPFKYVREYADMTPKKVKKQ